MILDGHIHVNTTAAQKRPFIDALREAGVDGGLVFSAHPQTPEREGEPYERRVDHVVELCEGEPGLYPVFYINPVDKTAARQVEYAVERGVAGFKIICGSFYPSDPRCLETCRLIASHKKPVTFHSGILWDGTNPSGRYNRPVEFEALLQVEGLRFALAHISWPWCDECVAVYGKLDDAFRRWDAGAGGVEMFIDNTPGTPEIYRADALKKVLFSGYDASRNMFFGSDGIVEDYNPGWARRWIDTDTGIYEALGLDAAAVQNFFSGNLLRFLGEGDA